MIGPYGPYKASNEPVTPMDSSMEPWTFMLPMNPYTLRTYALMDRSDPCTPCNPHALMTRYGCEGFDAPTCPRVRHGRPTPNYGICMDLWAQWTCCPMICLSPYAPSWILYDLYGPPRNLDGLPYGLPMHLWTAMDPHDPSWMAYGPLWTTMTPYKSSKTSSPL